MLHITYASAYLIGEDTLNYFLLNKVMTKDLAKRYRSKNGQKTAKPNVFEIAPN